MQNVVLVLATTLHKTHVRVGAKIGQEVQKHLVDAVLVDLHHGSVRNLDQQMHMQPVVVLAPMLESCTHAYPFNQLRIVGAKVHTIAASVALKPPPQERVFHHQIHSFAQLRQVRFIINVPVNLCRV